MKMDRKRFLVVGLGVLGTSVATRLAEEGAEVIVVDQSHEQVEAVRDKVAVAAIGDATDRKMLEQLGARSVDAAVVCVGENFQCAVLATVHLLELQVKHVAVRANSDLAASIMRRLGAHEVFFVEHAMGRMIAHRLANTQVMHEMDLGEGYRIVQIHAPQSMWRKSLNELSLPAKHNIQVIAVRAAKDRGAMRRPAADTIIEDQDLILISGHEDDISAFLRSSRKES